MGLMQPRRKQFCDSLQQMVLITTEPSPKKNGMVQGRNIWTMGHSGLWAILDYGQSCDDIFTRVLEFDPYPNNGSGFSVHIIVTTSWFIYSGLVLAIHLWISINNKSRGRQVTI